MYNALHLQRFKLGWIRVILLGVLAIPHQFAMAGGPLKVIQSTIEFRVKNAELQVGGDFKAVDTQISFYPQNPEKSEFSATIDVTSIHTGIRLRDKHLKGKFYFNADLFPQMQVSSTQVKALGAGLYRAMFKVKIKGIEKELEITFQVSEQQGKYVFSSRFFLNRRDFNLGGRSWTMSNNIEVSVKFVTTT